MDGRGRFAQSLTWIAPRLCFWRAAGRMRASARVHAHARAPARIGRAAPPSAIRRGLRRCAIWLFNLRVPSGAGLTACGAFFLATLAYGLVIGDRAAVIVGAFKGARDAAANAAGFRIAAVALAGGRHVSREQILASAGVTGSTSLLFLDVEDARERLKTNPWIADATLLKLYPDRLQIDIKEREPFALWQQNGRVSVVAGDGTVLEPYVDPRLARLPLVVGAGAAARAKDFLALLDRYPELREQVRASVLIGERRWNLRLRNGLDIRLSETGVAEALARLAALEKDKKLISRDIVWIDLRLPDRVTVELSEGAAAQRAEALKDKKPAKKGGAA
jgi:cell division protein FtsQ